MKNIFKIRGMGTIEVSAKRSFLEQKNENEQDEGEMQFHLTKEYEQARM